VSFACCREFSKQLNDSRIKVLQARETSVHSIVKDAHAKLIEIAANKKQYKSLLTDLTVQVCMPRRSALPMQPISTCLSEHAMALL
jgi:vacuolar-type H+-ATPase subunit E/Vma4